MKAEFAIRDVCVLFAVVLVGLFSAASAQGGGVITPVDASVDSAYYWNWENNGSQVIGTVGLTTNSGPVTSWTQAPDGSGYGMWLNWGSSGGWQYSPTGHDWVKVNLSAAGSGIKFDLSKIYLWQHNQTTGRGVRDFNVYGSKTYDPGNESFGLNWASYHLIGYGTLASAPGTAPITCETFSLTDANGIQAVYLDILNNYGDTYTGLSKVRFEEKEKVRANLLIIW